VLEVLVRRRVPLPELCLAWSFLLLATVALMRWTQGWPGATAGITVLTLTIVSFGVEAFIARTLVEGREVVKAEHGRPVYWRWTTYLIAAPACLWGAIVIGALNAQFWAGE
jgi:hypothetical protein